MRRSAVINGLWRRLTVLTAACFLATGVSAESCGLCAQHIITNSELAKCLLGQYDTLASRNGGAIAVDLSGCETSRGVVDALPTAGVGDEEPDIQFIVSRSQLECLRAKLTEPGLVLDPLARIDLGAC